MGVVFLVVVPTEKFERKLRNDISNIDAITSAKNYNFPIERNQLNIQPQTTTPSNAVLKAEVELRHKNVPPPKKGKTNKAMANIAPTADVPMQTVLSDLLIKLEVEHVSWTHDKLENYFQVIFPAASGERTETILHCLIELGIGKRYNSSVSILPASVSYDATNDTSNEEDFDEVENSKWNSFVESIKSKLTVKQVVDGVRSGGSLTFDYLLLIVTADSLAALGLVENNASNIVAAMLVSPLMGPVMSITFGTIISDWQLVKVGFITLLTGMFVSLLFGFIFGLILGTTEMPWGYGDFPTEEMKGRGNYRSLWMGVLWALTSGSGVALALLQGSVGPLVGVAISASLLPPVVNCGLFWALACIWLQYEDKKIPHIKGEPYDLFRGNTSYQYIYTDYIPTEFFINGIISCTLTVVNVICIFITAIIVLKIKEVAAPYTSSPDLRRFWETDIREARRTNTLRRKNSSMMPGSSYDDLIAKSKTLGSSLEQALKEAGDDATLRKIRGVSYSANAAPEVAEMIAHSSTTNGSPTNGKRNSKDIELLEKLMKNLLEQGSPSSASSSPSASLSSTGFKKLRPLSRTLSRSLRLGSFKKNNNSHLPTITESAGSGRRNVIDTIRNAPQRFSTGEEETKNLTRNILE